MRSTSEMRSLLAGLLGFLGGILIFSAAREIYFAVSQEGVSITLSSAMRWIGTFRWLYDYQTLIALIGAWWAAKAVYDQLEHDKALAARDLQDRRAAARAVLPFALSSISEYAEKCCQQLKLILQKVEDHVLPTATEVPPFPELPAASIASIQELVQSIDDSERVFSSVLLSSLQIQQSRLIGLRRDRQRAGHIVFSLNLERYVVDAAEIYAQAAALYKFARLPNGTMPTSITKREIAAALHNMGIFDELYDNLVERYDLASHERWVPPFTAEG